MIKQTIRQILKLLYSTAILPIIYAFWCAINKIDDNTAIIADAHHNQVPVSLKNVEKELINQKFNIVYHVHDYSHSSFVDCVKWSFSFLKQYSRARYVFICDVFLPSNVWNKRKMTKLIQVHHGCGVLKKMGFDAKDETFIGNIYKRYDLVCASSPFQKEVLSNAMRLKDGVCVSIGTSKTDNYFDKEWVNECKKNFEKYNKEGKKVLLYAPTFRGIANHPDDFEIEYIEYLKKVLGNEWLVLIKVHPLVDSYRKSIGLPVLSNIEEETERLLPCIDLLVSDYSSIIMDNMVLEKPVVLYIPDFDEYQERRGLYINIESVSKYIIHNKEESKSIIDAAYSNYINGSDIDFYSNNRILHSCDCDGNSTKRIIDLSKELE